VSRRINPVDQVVAFFETAALDQAAMVLAIVRGVVARRQPTAAATTKGATRKRKGAPRPNGADVSGVSGLSRA